MGVAEGLLAVGEGALVQRDGLVQSPGRPVGGGEVVAGGHRVGVGVAENLFPVGEYLGAVGDGLSDTVAEFVQAVDGPAAQPQDACGQFQVLPAMPGREVLMQGHDLSDDVTGSVPILLWLT